MARVPDARAGVALDAARLSALREGFEAGGANRFAQNALRVARDRRGAEAADAPRPRVHPRGGHAAARAGDARDAQPERSWIVAAHRAVEYALAARST